MILLSIEPLSKLLLFFGSRVQVTFACVCHIDSGENRRRFFSQKKWVRKKSLDMLNLQQNGLQTTLAHKCRRIINNTPSSIGSTALAHNVCVCECVCVCLSVERGSRNFNYGHSLKGSFALEKETLIL